ncbi:MAG: Stp1/IreP family PP2C-type Ser/Thr phosphatase [Erysipelotrichia bacterium]|nr:Stp1/IreP family PP2C-type Ser/Thr phosphatase [Erysipelotrichia bacterium]
MNNIGASDKGLLRKSNQDCYRIVSKDNEILTVVCDGIGGNRAGDVASSLAADVLGTYFKNNYMPEDVGVWYNNAVQIVNKAVLHKSSEVEEYKGMGTTLVSALITENTTYIANVGDSRAYILTKDQNLRQITNDHTVLNELVQKKGIEYDVAAQFIGKNVISRAIGIADDLQVDIYDIDNRDYDILLLCSDGLHGYVDENVIKNILVGQSTLETKCRKLIDEANKSGGYDNVTVVLCQR